MNNKDISQNKFIQYSVKEGQERKNVLLH